MALDPEAHPLRPFKKVPLVTARTLPLALAASMAAATSLVSASSSADLTKDQCVDANAKGQDLRRSGKLTSARELLRQCSAPSCPSIVRNDCTKRLDELESVQPAIIFDAKDGSGRDVSVVNVTVDGRPLVDKLDGTALRVDPGEHVFVFTVPDQPPVTQTFVLKEGDSGRRERIVIGALPATPAPGEGGGTLSTPPSGGEGSKSQRIVGLVAGGLGVAGLAAGGVFGVLTLSEASKQKTDCASTAPMDCASLSQANTDHQMGVMDRTIAIAGFIGGGALLLGGTILFLTGRHSSPASATTGVVLLPAFGPDGGEMLLRGKF